MKTELLNMTNIWLHKYMNAFEIKRKKATPTIHNVTLSHTHSHLSLHTNTCMHTHTHTHTHTHACTHKQEKMHMHYSTQTYTHTHKQTHAQTHKHMRRQRLRRVPLLLLVAPPQRQWVPERWPGCPQRWPRIHSAACLKQGSRITHL